MKIALCHTSVLPRRGGCETYIASLARRLSADGHAVHLYACEWDADALPGRISCHKVHLPPLPRFLRPWCFSRACGRMIERDGTDVSVGFDKIAGMDVYYPQGGMYDASVALSLGKHRSPLLRGFLRSLKCFQPAHLSYLMLEHSQYHRPGAVVLAISDMVRGHLVGHGVDAASVRCLPIAPPRERLAEQDREGRRASFRERWRIGEGVVALFVSMNHRLKGLVPLLHALATCRQTPMDLVVAGAPETGGFRRLARSLGIADRVRFVGYHADMREVYFASDFLVHPTFYDPCSNVVLEALACGLPVLTSRHNGAAELLHRSDADGTCAEGYVIPNPHDHDRLASRMLELADPRRRRQCAAAARETAEGWTFEHHYQGLMDVLTAVRRGQARLAG